MPATVTIQLRKNADFYRAFQLVDSEAVPIDLTGSTLAMKVRYINRHQAAIASITVTDAVNGRFTVYFNAESLAAFEPRDDYSHDLIWTQPSGLRRAIWEGTAIVVDGAT